MITDINLLLRTDEESLKRKKRIRILNFVAAGLLIIVGLISLVVFLLIQGANSPSIRKEQNDVLKKISQFQDRQSKLFILNNRIDSIDKILKTRKDISKTMNELLAKMPDNLSINSFEINAKSIVLTGESNSLYSIAQLINNLTDMVYKKEILKSLTLSSLTLDNSSNAYQVSLKSDL